MARNTRDAENAKNAIKNVGPQPERGGYLSCANDQHPNHLELFPM